MRVGETVLVFDHKEWNQKDVGDNSQFYKPATILKIYTEWPLNRVTADVQFHHDQRVSKGHFLSGIKRTP